MSIDEGQGKAEVANEIDEKENGIIFWMTKEGKVLLHPNSFIQPSSWNAQPILEKIAPEVIDFMEYLIHWKYRKEFKKLESK